MTGIRACGHWSHAEGPFGRWQPRRAGQDSCGVALITRREAVGLLLGACAGFAASPEAEAAAGAGDHVLMLEMAVYTLRRLGEGDHEPVAGVLATADAVLHDGDAAARELVEFGLVGELANENLWPTGLDAMRLLRHVGPEAGRTRAMQGLAAGVAPPRRPPAGGGVVWGEIWIRRPRAS